MMLDLTLKVSAFFDFSGLMFFDDCLSLPLLMPAGASLHAAGVVFSQNPGRLGDR